jgi:Flp pilus assembly protein TadD/GTP-binding protein EngB required for normal cell division
VAMGILDRIAGRIDELVGGDDGSSARADNELEQARGLLERGDIEAAVEGYGRATDLDPSNPDAWWALGTALAELERFEPARDAFRRVLTLPLSPDLRPHAQAGLGRLYAKAGQFGKAIRELRKAADALPDDAEVHAALGRALVAAGEPEGADWLARAARLPGGAPSFLVEAASAKTDAFQGTRLLREAVDRAPHDAGIRVALARHLVLTGDSSAALAEAVAATVAQPTDSRAWGALREAHAAAGDYFAAIADARCEAAHGAPPPFSVWIALALGAENGAAVEEAIRHGGSGDPGWTAAQALLAKTLEDVELVALAEMAPHASARRFVVRAMAPPPPPARDVYALLAWAERLATKQRASLHLAVPMARALEAFDRPLLVAVMGEFNAGKSSFVNALAGQAIAPVGVTPTTATINVLRYGQRGGRAIYHDGTARELRADAIADFLHGLSDDQAAAIRLVEIFAPIEALRRVEIVDTPGLNSLRSAHEKVARDFLVDADAIVWVFAAGQAAKASEREALALAHTAGKRVLGVINKIDVASRDEIDAIVRHVQAELGDLVERVVPLSARAAVEAQGRLDADALESSGLPIVSEALESGFYARARELKRATAIAALRRFVTDARATLVAAPPDLGASDEEHAIIAAAVRQLSSTLAAERVALRSRLEEGIRAAAFEVREFVRPRAWLFGEHSADPGDEAFLCDLLEDSVVAATSATRTALLSAIAPQQIGGLAHTADLGAAIDGATERFRAYARGIVEGAAAVFFRIDLPRIRLDLGAIHGALVRWSPDPEEALFKPIDRAIRAFAERAHADLLGRRRTAEIVGLIPEEHVLGPLTALVEALTALEHASAGESHS